MSNPYTKIKSGKRKDLGNIYFRSAAEANYARYLRFVGIAWEYEPKEFFFDSIRRGCVSYTPDFYLPQSNVWVEFKGWLRKKDMTKFRRFKKFYPKEFNLLNVVFEAESKRLHEQYIPELLDIGFEYTKITAYQKRRHEWGRLIPGWEY